MQVLCKLSGSMQQARPRRDSHLKKLERSAVLILTHASLKGDRLETSRLVALSAAEGCSKADPELQRRLYIECKTSDVS